MGAPRFWRGPPLEFVPKLAPYGLLHLEGDDFRVPYRQRLDRHALRIVASLADVARRHPGQRLVLCCYEDVWAGQHCHRTDFAAWAEERFGLVVPELPASHHDSGGGVGVEQPL